MEIRSDVFQPGQPIPKKYSQDGQSVSPPLMWTDVPPETRELALVVEDPDAPKPNPNPYIHWILCKIPPNVQELNEGVPASAHLQSPAGAIQGKNSAGKVGYVGPAPPPGHGTHHYHFKLFALDQPINASGSVDKSAFDALISGHILAQTDLVGTYERP